MNTIYDKFTSWYLRFNGYFTVDNFIVHAGDDENRIRYGLVGQHTETDTLAVRWPYSIERTGNLEIANHDLLVQDQDERYDVVIAESKSGNTNKPNPAWRNNRQAPIEYLIRFIGLFKEPKISEIANELVTNYFYEDKNVRFRYIIFAKERNQYYLDRGVKYITFSQIASFLVGIRGQCWLQSGIGVKSLHQQWDEQIKHILEIANDHYKSIEKREKDILKYLDLEYQREKES